MWRNKSSSCYKGLDNQQIIDIDYAFPWFAFPFWRIVLTTKLYNDISMQMSIHANGTVSECLMEFHWKQV